MSAPRISVSSSFSWQMGHRLPHAGRCNRLHGHTYSARITVSGPVRGDAEASDNGMVVDPALVESIIADVVSKWSHMTLVWSRDPEAQTMAHVSGVVLVPWVPTMENIARHLFTFVDVALMSPLQGRARVSRVVVEDGSLTSAEVAL